MITSAILTYQITTSVLSDIDLVKEGWQIKFSTTDGLVVATKQDVIKMFQPATAAMNMSIQNIEKHNTHVGDLIITKIDFGPGKIGVVWNIEKRVAEAWLH